MGNEVTCFNMIKSERYTVSKKLGKSTGTHKTPAECMLTADENTEIENHRTCSQTGTMSVNELMKKAVENNDHETLIALIKSRQASEWSNIYQYVKNRDQPNPVETACLMGHLRLVDIFLENGCSPNLPTTSGRLIHTLLKSIQAKKIHVDSGRVMIEKLCKQGCNVNLKDIHYKTTLLYGAEIGNIKILQTLLLAADPNILRCEDVPNGFTPLHMSVMRGDLDCVLEILKYLSSSDFVNMQDNRGKTALHLSLVTMCKNLQYLNSLANNGTKDKLQDNQLRILLCLQENSIAITETLLLHGADPNGYGNSTTNNNNGDDHLIIHTNTPLFLALSLVHEDETASVLNKDISPFSEWTKCLQSFVPSSPHNDDHDKPSSYSSLVRLLVLFGAECRGTRVLWRDAFGNCSRIEPLVEEIFLYWECKCEKPERLLHMCKKVIRNLLVVNFNLQNLHKLPLPIPLKAYIKYQYL